MKHFRIGIIVALTVWFVNQGYAQVSPRAERLFYYVNTENAFKSFKDHIDQITVVSPKAYDVDENGTVWGGVDPRVIKLAREHNVKVMPLLKNRGFDQELLHKLLSDSVAVGRMVRTLVHLCTENKYMGIQFDFENLNMLDRNLYTAMCRRAAQALHQHGFELSLAVVHKPEQDPGTTAYLAWLYENWREGYDLKKLAKIVDFISVMTYSQHTGRTTPGPVAALPWVEKVVKYFLKYVPPEKLSLGIPLYSEHWYTAYDAPPSTVSGKYAHSTSKTLSYGEVEALLDSYNAKAVWDDTDEVNYAVLNNDGVFEYLYIEDARSFAAKFDIMKKYHLRGFSAWVIGDEDPGIWKLLK